MSYYCGECAIWVGSSDVDRYGRRWCSYSRKYEESNQNTYGCRGFVYNGRTVLTKVCEILNLPVEKWFGAFDAVKNAYVAPMKMEWLTNYCKIGPQIAQKLDEDEKRCETASKLMREYIEPAFLLWENGQAEQSAEKYREMIVTLARHYCLV